VLVLGVTGNPDSAWVTQQARNLAVGEGLRGLRFLIRDRDTKFTGSLRRVFRSEGVTVIETRNFLEYAAGWRSGGGGYSSCSL